MSAHVSSNLLNELMKKIKCETLPMSGLYGLKYMSDHLFGRSWSHGLQYNLFNLYISFNFYSGFKSLILGLFIIYSSKKSKDQHIRIPFV